MLDRHVDDGWSAADPHSIAIKGMPVAGFGQIPQDGLRPRRQGSKPCGFGCSQGASRVSGDVLTALGSQEQAVL
jgi:hypothetical protein